MITFPKLEIKTQIPKKKIPKTTKWNKFNNTKHVKMGAGVQTQRLRIKF